MAEAEPENKRGDSPDSPAVWHQRLPWAPSQPGSKPAESVPGKRPETLRGDEAAPAKPLPEPGSAVAKPGKKRGRRPKPSAPQESQSPEGEKQAVTKRLRALTGLTLGRARLAEQPAPAVPETGEAAAAHGTEAFGGRRLERNASAPVSAASTHEPLTEASKRFSRLRGPQATGAVLLGTLLLGAPFVLTSVGTSDTSEKKHTSGAEPESPPPEAYAPAGPGDHLSDQPTKSARGGPGEIKSTATARPRSKGRPTSDLAIGIDVAAAPPAQPPRPPEQHASSHTPISHSVAVMSKSAPKATTLYVHHDEQLFPGQSWHTNRITLTMQTDGNFVIYDNNYRGLWSTRTNGQGYRAIMQTDGNFVIYDRANHGIWSTGTAGHDGAFLSLQNDGNVTVRYQGRSLWAAGTRG